MRQQLPLFHGCQLRIAKTTSAFPFILDSPDFTFFRFAKIQGTIWPHCNTHRTVGCVATVDDNIPTGKPIWHHARIVRAAGLYRPFGGAGAAPVPSVDAGKFDGSKRRRYPGRPRVDGELEQLVVRMATENRDRGYDRIVGALANLGHELSDETLGNILRRHGIAPAPQRKHTTTWNEFIRSHLAVLAGSDFFSVEVLTPARAGHLLRAVFHSFGEPAGGCGRDHASSERGVDAAGRQKYDHGRVGVPR